MKKLIAATVLIMASTTASAVPMTIFDRGGDFDYQTLTMDLWGAGGGNWVSVDYSTFDFSGASASSWSNGNAAFGSAIGASTFWAFDTDLALQTEFDFSGGVSELLLSVASDNGFVVFLNGSLVAKENVENFTKYWEYDISIDPTLLVQGTNTLQVLAESHGDSSFFDMRLSGSNGAVAAVSEPATLMLLAAGLFGLTRVRRK